MNKNFVWTIFGTIFWTILLTIFGTMEIFAENKTLPEDIKTEFVKANINLENVGLYIQNLNKAPQKILINYNGEKLFKPASVMKLVTTYAGILNLGTDFVWQTKIYADNKVNEDGILNGNLYIFGGGDPNLTFDELYKLLTKLFVEYNVKRINGNIIFNNSLFNLSDELQNTLAEDFDGYKHTYNIANAKDYKSELFKVIDYCINYKSEGTNKGDWHLGSTGEMIAIAKNLIFINSAIKLVGIGEIMSLYWYWTSSHFGEGQIFGSWCVYLSNSSSYDYYNLGSKGQVRPLLAFNKQFEHSSYIKRQYNKLLKSITNVRNKG